MSILSKEIPTFRPIRDWYYVGCYINDITAVVGGPDKVPESHYEARKICNELCHRIIDEMMDWGCGLTQPEDFKPLIRVYMKQPEDYFIQRDEMGRDVYIDIMSKPHNGKSSTHVVKVVLTAKEWYV